MTDRAVSNAMMNTGIQHCVRNTDACFETVSSVCGQYLCEYECVEWDND